MLTTSARMTLRLFRSTLCFAVLELRLLYTCGTGGGIVTVTIHIQLCTRNEDPYNAIGEAYQELSCELGGTVYTTLQWQQAHSINHRQ